MLDMWTYCAVIVTVVERFCLVMQVAGGLNRRRPPQLQHCKRQLQIKRNVQTVSASMPSLAEELTSIAEHLSTKAVVDSTPDSLAAKLQNADEVGSNHAATKTSQSQSPKLKNINAAAIDPEDTTYPSNTIPKRPISSCSHAAMPQTASSSAGAGHQTDLVRPATKSNASSAGNRAKSMRNRSGGVGGLLVLARNASNKDNSNSTAADAVASASMREKDAAMKRCAVSFIC